MAKLLRNPTTGKLVRLSTGKLKRGSPGDPCCCTAPSCDYSLLPTSYALALAAGTSSTTTGTYRFFRWSAQSFTVTRYNAVCSWVRRNNDTPAFAYEASTDGINWEAKTGGSATVYFNTVTWGIYVGQNDGSNMTTPANSPVETKSSGDSPAGAYTGGSVVS